MNLLNKLTIKNLKLNKKRTIVTVVGIILSVALITAVATMYSSAVYSSVKFETKQKGNYHVAFHDVPKEEIAIIKNNRKVDETYLTKDIGFAKLANSKNEYKPYAFVKAFTKDSFKNLTLNLVKGRLPKNENEILIPTHLKTNGRVVLNIGDTINLEVGKRISDGEEVSQDISYNPDGKEEIIDTVSKEYKIVGIIERPDTCIEEYTAPGYTFATYMDESSIQDKADIFAKYTKEGLNNYEEVTANILGINGKLLAKMFSNEELTRKESNQVFKELEKAKYAFNCNDYLIKLQTNPLEASGMDSLGIVVAIICVIIVFTSVFCIKNSFDISITEKIKQYGMLRSVGATRKQIKRNVLYEGTILGVVGIPLGILLGFIASFILIIVSNYFISDMFASGLKLYLDFSWGAVIVAVILGVLTIYLSALGSARRAAKVSPIDSIRNSANIKIKSKKLRSPKIISKLFGIGGELSHKNLKRNRKKYRTTVISIVVSVFVFIALSSFMGLAFETIKTSFSSTDYNIMLNISSNNTDEINKKVLELNKLDNIEDITVYRNEGYYIDDAKYDNKYIEKFKEGYGDAQSGVITISEKSDELEGYIHIAAIGKEQYNKFINQLGLEYDNIKDKGILLDTHRLGKYDEEKKKIIYYNAREFMYEKGDKLTGKLNTDEKFDIEVGYVTDKKPFGTKGYIDSMLLISDDLYDKICNDEICKDIYYIYFKSSNPDKLQDDIDEVLKGYEYNINNVAENVKMMENFYTLIGIFLYGFIIVISLIGITNIFNTITTNMELRKQEFAMLKSVGMTSKEFSRMIRLESIFMGTKSLVIGVPIGIGLSYLIYYYLGKSIGLPYSLPLIAIIISILAVFILITCIMKYSINKINKQNIIETIRNENI